MEKTNGTSFNTIISLSSLQNIYLTLLKTEVV